MSEERDDERLLEKLGGDSRIYDLFSLAITAYTYLPHGMFNFRTGKSTRDLIVKAVEALGFRAASVPWERFPKRFHKNLPKLQLFEPHVTDAEIEQYWVELIAAQSPEKVRRGKRAATPEGTKDVA